MLFCNTVTSLLSYISARFGISTFEQFASSCAVIIMQRDAEHLDRLSCIDASVYNASCVCVCPCVFYVSRVCLSAVLYVFIQCWVIYISKVYKYKILFKRI